MDSAEERPALKTKRKRKKESGIIYLSRIPTLMNVKKAREILSSHGEVGRLFLQPDERTSSHKKNRQFTEGWVEFMDKRIAKNVAATLNNQQIGGKRRAPWYDELWNIKYLSKFKWAHLNERLAYEREVHKQRLRTEVAQAKKESNFYIQNVEKRRLQAKLQKKGKELKTIDKEWTFKQRNTEEDILAKKRKLPDDKSGSSKRRKSSSSTQNNPDNSEKVARDHSFLQSIFSGGLQASSEDE